ncbi:MAG: T9SS type A sorting domain-containing protein [Candidatus Kapabacteria bacterium]|nr:T9SS type A sorting domain-containing protein [Candidatus Kapabacteria bacterium]
MKNATLVLLLWLMPFAVLAQRIATGGRHSLAICADGSVMAWGFNSYGQLGNGTLQEQASGVQVAGLNNVKHVAGGLFHSLFLMSDSTVQSCGRNVLGPLGDGTTLDRPTPVRVGALSGIIQISGGGEHSLFLKSDGTVWACGANSSGQLGDGTTSNRNTPVQVSGLSNIVQVAAGAEFSLFLQSDGRVLACGHNGSGQLGNGTTTASRSPLLIDNLDDIKQITTGEWHSIFVRGDGTVYACGRNMYGQLGDGTTMDRYVPTRIQTLSRIVLAEAGGIHTLFVNADGIAWSCGLNSGGNNNGQLGDGTETDRHTPVMILPSWGSARVVEAQAAREHSILLQSDGSIWGCGRNNYGQLGYGTLSGTNSTTSVRSSTVCDVNVLSVIEHSTNQDSFSVFPNPFAHQTTIKPDVVLTDATLTLYDLQGRRAVVIERISGQNIDFYRGGLSPGMYRMCLTEGNRLIVRKTLMVLE